MLDVEWQTQERVLEYSQCLRLDGQTRGAIKSAAFRMVDGRLGQASIGVLRSADACNVSQLDNCHIAANALSDQSPESMVYGLLWSVV